MKKRYICEQYEFMSEHKEDVKKPFVDIIEASILYW